MSIVKNEVLELAEDFKQVAGQSDFTRSLMLCMLVGDDLPGAITKFKAVADVFEPATAAPFSSHSTEFGEWELNAS